ncbi:guanine nucleotide exchange factor, putative [Entamoeba invadens IP1]|uniref:Guanine nucleotide exchange factor, putative n=1 Tax=Entamoeba invadens IP1 TaxID=370355 RepID=A0A0A1UE93_ENTIV|nr:guanine nucleotide exchange factor, putative [Entamoeba invadens IP1]ELP94916.1 guanine nucleotide exchange factor, putative [Entamoeba invadens IP1]|eukprot:XP_004261687.1 guanine nucleotide exchange factor, putative [Entamoeba invadens IP1]
MSHLLYDTTHFNHLRNETRGTFICVKPSETLMGYMLSPRNFVSEQRFQIRLSREVEFQRGKKFTVAKKDTKTTLNVICTETGKIEKDKDNQIMKGNVFGLVQAFCNDEKNGSMKAFVWTYTGYCTTEEMLRSMFLNHDVACNDDNKKSLLVRARVVSALKYWIENIWNVIKSNEKNVDDIMYEFLKRLKNYGMTREHDLIRSCYQRVMDGVEVEYFKTQRNIEFSIPMFSDIVGHSIETSVFNLLHPLEYARQVTLITSDMFRRIKLYEMLMWSNSEKESCQNIMSIQKFFNGLQNHFTRMLLSESRVEKRIKIVERLMQIANYCYTYHNFDTVLCIMLLFGTSAIHRLKRTFEGLNQETQDIMKKLKPLTLPDNNKEVLRAETNKVIGNPMVPYIGLILSDLTFTNFGNKTKEGDLINFAKCRQISKILEQVVFMHQQTYSQLIVSDINIRAMILSDAALELTMSDKESYELSQRTEPKVYSLIPPEKSVNRYTLHFPGKRLKTVSVSNTSSTLLQVFYDALGVDVSKHQIYIFYTGQSINESISPNNPVNRIKIVERDTEVVVCALQKVMYVNIVLEYNKVLCQTTIPLDPTLPLEYLNPILQTYTSTASYPILLKSNRVCGCMLPSLSLEEIEWSDGDTIFLIPIRELKNGLGELDYDSLRFKSSRFFSTFTGTFDGKRADVVIVDVMVLVYITETLHSVFPIETMSLRYDPWGGTIEFSFLGKENIEVYQNVVIEMENHTVRELMKRICQISKKQRKVRLIGTNRFYVESDTTGIPVRLEKLINVMYLSKEFTRMDFFDFDRKDILGNLKQFEEDGIIEPKDTAGIFVCYIKSLGEPLISSDHTKHFISFDFLDREDRIELLKRAFHELTETIRPISVLVVKVLSLFFSFTKNPAPQGFSDLLFDNLPDKGLAERILTYLVLNAESILPTMKTEENHLYTPFLPSVDFLPNSTILQINSGIAISNEPSNANDLIYKKNSKISPRITQDLARSFIETPRRHAPKRNLGRTDSMFMTNSQKQSQLTMATLSDSEYPMSSLSTNINNSFTGRTSKNTHKIMPSPTQSRLASSQLIKSPPVNTPSSREEQSESPFNEESKLQVLESKKFESKRVLQIRQRFESRSGQSTPKSERSSPRNVEDSKEKRNTFQEALNFFQKP